MLPPFMIDGRNTAEVFLANMNYALVGAAVVTQEYIDGIQNDYLMEVMTKYPDRFFVCGMCEFRKPGFYNQAVELIDKGFKAIKIPGHRLQLKDGRVMLNSDEMMRMFHLMEDKGVILSIDMAEGDLQVGEMEEIISECPYLKIAIGHFGMVTKPDWKKQIMLARHKNVMIESALNQRMTALRDQIYEMCEEKGEWAAMPQARSQAMHYMKGLHGAAALRRYCSMLEHFSDVDTLIEAVYRLQ